MALDADQQFQQLLQNASADPNVLGLFLGGSRGKGFGSQSSDYDICLVVEDAALEQARQRYEPLKSASIDLWMYSLSEFRGEAAWGGAEHWDRYSYTHVTALIDKRDGEIQRLIDEKGMIPEERRVPLVRHMLDGYINSLYRSLKCLRHRNMLGARLEAHDSIGYLLCVIFALEGRHHPYYGYLERELRKYPLKRFPLSGDELLAKISAIAESADLTTQQELLALIEGLCRPAGFGDVFDGWGADYSWMQSFRG